MLASGLQLRPGRPSDLPQIRQAVQRERLNPLGLISERFTVAERAQPDGSGSRVVGFGQVKPIGGGTAALELSSLVVEEKERGKGVGTALIRSLAELAGQTPLFLTTISRNAPLYRRCGFEEVPRNQVPAFLQFEYFLGLAMAWLVARDRLVLMRLAQQQQQQQETQQ